MPVNVTSKWTKIFIKIRRRYYARQNCTNESFKALLIEIMRFMRKMTIKLHQIHFCTFLFKHWTKRWFKFISYYLYQVFNILGEVYAKKSWPYLYRCQHLKMYKNSWTYRMWCLNTKNELRIQNIFLGTSNLKGKQWILCRYGIYNRD